jgi:hypothetical protein
VRVLPCKLGPSRHTVDSLIVLFSDTSLEAVFVLNSHGAIWIFRKDYRPNSEIISLALVSVSVPVVEIAKLKVCHLNSSLLLRLP